MKGRCFPEAHATRISRYSGAELARFNHENVARQGIEQALGRVTDKDALEARSGHRSHDYD
jgi:hypothetical protein